MSLPCREAFALSELPDIANTDSCSGLASFTIAKQPKPPRRWPLIISQQLDVLRFTGRIDYDARHDAKAERRRR